LRDQIPIPADFPEACLIKGQGAASRRTLELIAPDVAALLRDPKIKEVVVCPRGVRIVRQLSQGSRGQHLILRQSVFENARLEAQELKNAIDEISRIESAVLDLDLVTAA
jgi:hypothetical protein